MINMFHSLILLLSNSPKTHFSRAGFLWKCFPRKVPPGKGNRLDKLGRLKGWRCERKKVSLVLMNWRTSKSCQRIHPDFGDLVGFSWGKQKSPDTWYIYNNSYEIYMYVNCKYILYMGKIHNIHIQYVSICHVHGLEVESTKQVDWYGFLMIHVTKIEDLELLGIHKK